MQNLINLFSNKVSLEPNSKCHERDSVVLTTEKLRYVINTIDNKLFKAECQIHFESDKLQKDLKNWVDKEGQKIHYLEETRHELLERILKKQTKIREIQDFMLWARSKNEELIHDNSSVLKELNQLQEKNRHLRRNFVSLINKTRKLETSRREQLHTFKNLYKTTPKYKNKALQTDDVTNMVNTERRMLRGRKKIRDTGTQCELLAVRARIIGHRGVMTDPIEPLIQLSESIISSDSSATLTAGESGESLLTGSVDCFEDCIQNVELLETL